jgi:hypothetical protein
MLFAIFDFRPGGAFHVTISKKVKRTNEGHANTIILYMRYLAETYDLTDLNGTVVLLLEDGMYSGRRHLGEQIPLIAFGRCSDDHQTFLMPDAAYIGARGYVQELQEIQEIDEAIPWEEKKPTVFWRGAGSGPTSGSGWKGLQRVQLSLIAKEFGNPDKLDARITSLVEGGTEEYKEGITGLGVLGDYVPATSFYQYRYQIDVDGVCNAWKSYYHKLYSACCVFKIDSQYEQWYYHRLKPWKHYIPVRKDLQNLTEHVDWALAHEHSSREIARVSSEEMQKIAFDEEAARLAFLIRRILECQTD